ncbi:MAG: hypothetical protein KOO62_13070 [candidate division Zixibacteria bacterium]|nr:hypothetical protein [candidate division Zixibacteria bacterium]
MSESEEKKDQAQPSDVTEETAAPKKSGLIKYLIIGVGAVVLVAGSVIVAMMFLGGEQAQDPENAEPDSRAEAQANSNAKPGEDDEEAMFDSLFDGEFDPDVLAQITENLAALDWEPDAGEMDEEKIVMSVEDSIEAVNWLEQEKSKLKKLQADLDSRQKELSRLDREVTSKIVRIEQAESMRVNSLAKLYDGMDARAVARLMANLDDETVVSLLPRMKAKNASAVLQLLPSKRAAKLSKQMITIAGK